ERRRYIQVSQHYAYRNSGEVYNSREKARQVHEAIIGMEGYFSLKDLDAELEQSKSAIYYHLQELRRRKFILKVGTEAANKMRLGPKQGSETLYVDLQEVEEEWTVHQVRKLYERLQDELDRKQQLLELYEEKKQQLQDYFEDLHDEISLRERKQHRTEINQVQRKIEETRQDLELLSSRMGGILRLYLARKQKRDGNCESSGNPDFRDTLDQKPIKA
ncbi:MAG: hypothetical protein ABEJ98_03335, partial [Candidatus Nanohaloarchaea archaeon]